MEGPGRGWASRVFFTDNGSTATEVAIKMGFRRVRQRRECRTVTVNRTFSRRRISLSFELASVLRSPIGRNEGLFKYGMSRDVRGTSVPRECDNHGEKRGV